MDGQLTKKLPGLHGVVVVIASRSNLSLHDCNGCRDIAAEDLRASYLRFCHHTRDMGYGFAYDLVCHFHMEHMAFAIRSAEGAVGSRTGSLDIMEAYFFPQFRCRLMLVRNSERSMVAGLLRDVPGGLPNDSGSFPAASKCAVEPVHSIMCFLKTPSTHVGPVVWVGLLPSLGLFGASDAFRQPGVRVGPGKLGEFGESGGWERSEVSRRKVARANIIDV